MTTPMDIMAACAKHLHDEGIGLWAPPPAPIPTGPLPPIVRKTLPSKPGTIIGVTVYDVEDPDTGLLGRTFRIQVRCRTAAGPADTLAEEVRSALVTDHPEQWDTTVRVQRVTRLSTAPLGLDAAGLDEVTVNLGVLVVA